MQENDKDTATQDDELKILFDNFEPLISSDERFMLNLQQRLDTIDLLHREIAAARRRNRRAVGLAALAGFVAGVLTCLLLPSLISFITNSALQGPVLSLIPSGSVMILWLLPAAAALSASLGIYNLRSRAGY